MYLIYTTSFSLFGVYLFNIYLSELFHNKVDVYSFSEQTW